MIPMIKETIHFLIQQAREDLENDLHNYGFNECLKLIIEKVPNELIPTYLTVLCLLDWRKNHPIIKEEKEDGTDQ